MGGAPSLHKLRRPQEYCYKSLVLDSRDEQDSARRSVETTFQRGYGELANEDTGVTMPEVGGMDDRPCYKLPGEAH